MEGSVLEPVGGSCLPTVHCESRVCGAGWFEATQMTYAIVYPWTHVCRDKFNL